jgi:hypothetical protein
MQALPLAFGQFSQVDDGIIETCWVAGGENPPMAPHVLCSATDLPGVRRLHARAHCDDDRDSQRVVPTEDAEAPERHRDHVYCGLGVPVSRARLLLS